MGKEKGHNGLITLYHGGVTMIEKPLVKVGRKNLDFGPGFYLTRREQQAKDWAEKAGRQMMEAPVVNVYTLDYGIAMEHYRCKVFENYDSQWLNFIVKCRQGYDPSLEYDLIEGGVANDRVIDTVEGYINGTIDERSALGELSKHQPNNQICILSQHLLDKCLVFQRTL